jgi:hypothetical protein
VFDTKGLDTSSAAFQKARTKCQAVLKGAFGGGAPPSSSAQAGPPPGEGVPPGEGPAG